MHQALRHHQLHPRTEIRHQIISLLRNKTSAGKNVYSYHSQDRVPQSPCPYPGIFVSFVEEKVALAKESPLQYQRKMVILIEGLLRHEGPGQLYDQLDEMAAEIEIALRKDRTLGGKAQLMRLVSTEIPLSPDLHDQGEGRILLHYQVEYFTQEEAPERQRESSFESPLLPSDDPLRYSEHSEDKNLFQWH